MNRVRKILEAEVASSTLVIHMADRSTDFLKAIYEGRGYPVLDGLYTHEELVAAIKAHDRIIMLGHGSSRGLFSKNFMLDDKIGPLLAEKSEGLYIWCNADAYAHRNKLSGLVSGMFISEVQEAAMFGIKATQPEVDDSNAAFARIVRQHLDTGQPLGNVRQCYTSAVCKITQYNSERLYIFDHGAASPALHASSQAHLPPPPDFHYRSSAQMASPSPFGPKHLLRGPHASYRPASDLFWPGEEVDLEAAFEKELEEWIEELLRLLPACRVNPEEIDERYDDLLGMYAEGYTPEEALSAIEVALSQE